jgi:DNA-binding NarL/FixJ family response regulator
MEKDRLTNEIETVLYRIMQESLNNIAKHAGAENVDILLERRNNHISLIVEDDGVGFEAEQAFGAGREGLGLIGMRERAALVGGTLEIESSLGNGRDRRCTHPCAEHSERSRSTMSKLHIILADDHKIMREGLRMLVNSQADMEVVGEADNGRMAVTLAQELQPDVVVMDVSMPELNGLKATEKLKELFPDIKVLTLTRHMDEGYLKQLLEAGASGYVLKQSASEELVRAIHVVVNGQTYLDPAITGQFVGKVIGRSAARGSPKGELSPREEAV